MATVHGESGAYADARSIAAGLGLRCTPSEFGDLAALERSATVELERATREATAKVERETVALRELCPSLKAEVEQQLAERRGARAVRIVTINTELARRRPQLRTRSFLVVFPRAAYLWFERLYLSNTEPRADRFTRARFQDAARRLETLSKSPQVEVAVLTKTVARRVGAIKQLRARPESAGAYAELRVAKALADLPPDYHVFHNVKLRAKSFLRDQYGVPIQSAQIDHVVVGPGGVFIIETKNWSAEFAQSSRGFNPHDQVGRASLLCYVLLKDSGYKGRVRTVIACCGQMVAKKNGSYAKILRPNRLRGYIEYFAGELPPRSVTRVAKFFKR